VDPAARTCCDPAVQPKPLLIFAAMALLLLIAAWIFRERVWRRPRAFALAGVVAVALVLVLRRVGWAELLVVVAVMLLPVLLIPPPRPRPRRPGRG
jgi:hypothetical protein